MAEPVIAVQVVYAGVHDVQRAEVFLPAGSTALQAVEAAGMLAQLPAEAVAPLQLGIHSRRIDGNHVLRDGDRVEIYRPLRLDPMASRRRRAGRG